MENTRVKSIKEDVYAMADIESFAKYAAELFKAKKWTWLSVEKGNYIPSEQDIIDKIFELFERCGSGEPSWSYTGRILVATGKEDTNFQFGVDMSEA